MAQDSSRGALLPGNQLTQTTQSIKLNSPYMDTICTLPVKDLYEKALELDVPFHKVIFK